MLGSSLFFLGRKSPHDAMAAQILALIGLVDALLAFLGYVMAFIAYTPFPTTPRWRCTRHSLRNSLFGRIVRAA